MSGHEKPGYRAHLRKYRISAAERQRCLSALTTLGNLEGVVKDLLREQGFDDSDHAHVCQALRVLADGPNGEFT